MEGSRVGSKEMGLFFMMLFYLCIIASSSSLQKTLASVSLQETNLGVKGKYKHSRGGVNEGDGGRSGIISRRYSVGYRNGYGSVNGGRSPGTGEDRNNGGSSSPYGQGGMAVIPVYAAGAANHHHNNHHSAGSCNQNSIGLFTLIATSLASLLVHIYVVFGYKC